MEPFGTPDRIRTGVTRLKTWQTRPLFDRSIEDGRQGRTRTYGVSNVPGLQPGAFATQRHLTDEILGALLGGQDSNLQLGSYPGWLTATYLTIRRTSEQSIKKRHLRRSLLPMLN